MAVDAAMSANASSPVHAVPPVAAELVMVELPKPLTRVTAGAVANPEARETAN